LNVLAQLIGGAVLLWAALIYPGWRLQGDEALVQSLVAMGLCLIPAAATYIWAMRAFRGAPADQMMAMLGGSAFRMILVLGVGYFLTQTWPETLTLAFWYWVLIFYMFVLGIEIRLLVKANAVQDAVAGPKDGASA